MVQAVTEAVQEAVQAARDEGIKFDVRANLYTLLAISGEPVQSTCVHRVTKSQDDA